MTDKMSLEDLYKQETGRTPIAEGCNGCSGYDVDYYDWLETRDAQRESLLAQRTAERDAYAESLVLCLEGTADARLIAAAPELKDVVIEGYELSRYAAASKGCNTNEFLEGLKERIELYQFACKQVIERATGQNIKEILQEARP